MQLLIDSNKKEQLQETIASGLKSVRIIVTIARVFLFVGLVGGGIYALLNVLMPSLSLVRVKGVLQKDVSWIIISTSFIVVPGVILYGMLKLLSKNIAGVNSNSRVDESLLVTDEYVQYAFRIKHQSFPNERRVITIGYAEIQSIYCNDRVEGLAFEGNILSEYYDDYRKNEPADTRVLDGVVIYDYFVPSLRDVLSSKNIEVSRRN